MLILLILAGSVGSLTLNALHDKVDLVITYVDHNGQALTNFFVLITLPTPPSEGRSTIIANLSTPNNIIRIRIDKAKVLSRWRLYLSRRPERAEYRIPLMIDAVWVNDSTIVASIGNTVLIDPLSRGYIYKKVVITPTWIGNKSNNLATKDVGDSRIRVVDYGNPIVAVRTDYKEYGNVMLPILSATVDENSVSDDTSDYDTLFSLLNVHFDVLYEGGWELAYSIDHPSSIEFHIGGITVQKKFSDIESHNLYTYDKYDPKNYAKTFYVSVIIVYEEWEYWEYNYYTARYLYTVEKVYVKDFTNTEIIVKGNDFVLPENAEKTLFKQYSGTGQYNNPDQIGFSPNEFDALSVGTYIYSLEKNDPSFAIPIGLLLDLPILDSFIITYRSINGQEYDFEVKLDAESGTSISVYICTTVDEWYIDRYKGFYKIPLTSIIIDEILSQGGIGGGGPWIPEQH